MNIYFIHPNLISLDSWPSLLKALNIEVVVDLLRYKSTAISPFTCNHEVFSEIDLIYNRNTLLPTDFDELSNTEQCNATKAAFRKIFAALADIGIERYHDKEPRQEGCGIIYDKYESNVLVLSTSAIENTWIQYIGQYFFQRIYRKAAHTSCRKFIDIIALDFVCKRSYKYSTQAEGFTEMFYYDCCKREIECNTMDEIYFLLENSFNITDSKLFKSELYEEIIHFRQKAEKAYIEAAQEEYERENEEMWSYGSNRSIRSNRSNWGDEEDGSDWGNDELEGMNEDFPGWGWNID